VNRLDAHGLSIGVPAGWDARIFERPESGATLHAASFALPHADGEFGSRATAAMGPDGLFLALTEYLPDASLVPGTGLFGGGRPHTIRPEQFDRRALLHQRAGQLGLQQFFSTDGRAFCLYVVAGSARHLRRHAETVTGLLLSLLIRAR
jgi:hypothetical protein